MTEVARPPRRDARISFFLFALVFVGHFGFGITTSFDSCWSVHVAMSIARRQTTCLDAYAWIPPTDQAIQMVDGRRYYLFPVGTPVLATPFVAAIDAVTSRLLTFQTNQAYHPFDLDAFLRRGIAGGVERFVAAIFTAVTSVLVYFLARERISTRARALLVALIFAFATPAWSTASRGLRQHGPTKMLLAAALLLLAKARERPLLAAFAALPLAYSYVVRPTNSLSIVVFTLYVALVHRRQLPLYLGLAAAIAVPFVAYNESVYHSLLSPYYSTGRLALTTRAFWVFTVNWISPSRGMLVFTPVFLFSLWGAWLTIRKGTRLDRAVAIVILLHSIAISCTRVSWHADMCFGPRFFSDMTPFFVWFLIPTVDRVAKSRSLVLVFALLAGAAFAIHRRGATSWDVYNWNLTPVYIDARPSRVWDLRDIQFLRGL